MGTYETGLCMLWPRAKQERDSSLWPRVYWRTQRRALHAISINQVPETPQLRGPLRGQNQQLITLANSYRHPGVEDIDLTPTNTLFRSFPLFHISHLPKNLFFHKIQTRWHLADILVFQILKFELQFQTKVILIVYTHHYLHRNFR